MIIDQETAEAWLSETGIPNLVRSHDKALDDCLVENAKLGYAAGIERLSKHLVENYKITKDGWPMGRGKELVDSIKAYEYDKLKAEVEILRAALMQIEDNFLVLDDVSYCRIALEALTKADALRGE